MRPWVRPKSLTASRIASVKLPANRSPAFLTQPEPCRDDGMNRKNSDRSADAPTGRRTLRWARMSSIHMGSYRKGETNMSGPIRMGCCRSCREITTVTPGGSSALGAVGLCPERYVTFKGVVDHQAVYAAGLHRPGQTFGIEYWGRSSVNLTGHDQLLPWWT